MLLGLTYQLMRFITDLVLVRTRSDAQLRAEVLALRRQLRVLEREVGKPAWQPADRILLAGLSRMLPTSGLPSLLPKLETLLRWHRLQLEQPRVLGPEMVAQLEEGGIPPKRVSERSQPGLVLSGGQVEEVTSVPGGVASVIERRLDLLVSVTGCLIRSRTGTHRSPPGGSGLTSHADMASCIWARADDTAGRASQTLTLPSCSIH